MALIKSISGIRGTIGGKPGESLTPVDIVRFTAAYGTWVTRRKSKSGISIVVGRDARTTGSIVNSIVVSTLRSLGINVTDLGLATTPTVEIAVTGLNASGGIILTASHNPANWNALKLLNEKGEFLSAADGNDVLKIAESEDFNFSSYEQTGSIVSDDTWNRKHIDKVLDLKLTDLKAIREADLSVVVDCINSVGGIILPEFLRRIGVKKITLLNGNPDGLFAHNPEPLPANLRDISDLVKKEKADVGFVVDPDVDRLAIVCEDGSMFGEEYTLVAVSDWILSHNPGNTVSNMSSTKALKDITEKHGGKYFTSAVGEVNVVEEMKLRNAVIGGEGNGGVIYPVIHYGRDALVGIALFLSLLARRGVRCSELRRSYPDYFIAKKKLTIGEQSDFNLVLSGVKKKFSNNKIDERDGLRIDTENGWVQIRKSNTEPIIRIYAESTSENEAEELSEKVIRIVKNL